MKKKIFVGVVLVLCILAVGVFFYMKKGKNFDGDIISFEYEYGSSNSGYYNYKIYLKDSKTYIVAAGLNGVDLNLDGEISNNTLSEIKKIVEDNAIQKWDGFQKKGENVSDGYSFSLKIKYSDGDELTASGYMKYPKNYDNGHKALTDYLDSIAS